jgi:hypothetical protein
MNEEIISAVEELRLRPADKTWFIPVMLSNCQIPDFNIGAGETLRDLQCVRMYEDWEKGVGQLLSAIVEFNHSSSKNVDAVFDKMGKGALEGIIEFAEEQGFLIFSENDAKEFYVWLSGTIKGDNKKKLYMDAIQRVYINSNDGPAGMYLSAENPEALSKWFRDQIEKIVPTLDKLSVTL